jgi:hypothetical protein
MFTGTFTHGDRSVRVQGNLGQFAAGQKGAFWFDPAEAGHFHGRPMGTLTVDGGGNWQVQVGGLIAGGTGSGPRGYAQATFTIQGTLP